MEPEIKEQAEQVLERLGIPMSNAVGMFLRQVVLQGGIPFEMKLPQTIPLNYDSLTREQFDAEMEKGMVWITQQEKNTNEEAVRYAGGIQKQREFLPY